MIFFGDTSGWIALFNEDDKYHLRARSWARATHGQNHRLVTTDYVLDETITHLQATANHATAEDFANWILKQEHIRVIHISEAMWDDALATFRKYDDKDFSFSDCTSFVVMRQHGLRDVFSFDRHFEQMGYRLWPH